MILRLTESKRGNPNLHSSWQQRLAKNCSRYRHWLLDRGSLTRRIQARCPAFSVRHVRQRRGQAMLFEQPGAIARAIFSQSLLP